MGYRIGIDVGGTFTDFLLVAPDGSFTVDKNFTTRKDESEGVLHGLSRLADRAEVTLSELLAQTDVIIHGTTTADNTMIELNGAKTGLLVTSGHRDELELRRGYKENIWNQAFPPPPWIVPRRYRLTVPERLDHKGNVLVPLDEEAVRAAVRRLKKAKVESIAIVTLFSWVNPAHEQRIAEIVAEEYPGVEMTSPSHLVNPAPPEFERISTTVVNAYVGPRVRAYLVRLAERLEQAGFRKELLVMQSSGGISGVHTAIQRPIATLASGPTGGVMGAAEVARAAGVSDFISVDMGGTSYDVCLVRGGQPTIKSSWNWVNRYLIALPMVDVISIGAGGGSIARVEAGGLQVGPASAGSEPGPICYGRGGTEPTVTDANLVLGYLNPDSFAGGSYPLKTDTVEEIIGERIGEPLGYEQPVQAAWGIYRLVNADMNNAIRRVSAERGQDPREYALVVFGGNGAVHALAQADDLGLKTVLIPKTAPAFSALGLLVADHLIDQARGSLVPSKEADPKAIERMFRDLERSAEAELRKAGVKGKRFAHDRFAQCRYAGQTWDIDVPVEGAITKAALERIAADFHRIHEEEHTYARADEDVLIAGVRVRSRGLMPKPELPPVAGSRKAPVPAGTRKAYFGRGWRTTTVFDGERFLAGQQVSGPAIIEEPFTTIVVPPGWDVKLDKRGNYVATKGA